GGSPFLPSPCSAPDWTLLPASSLLTQLEVKLLWLSSIQPPRPVSKSPLTTRSGPSASPGPPAARGRIEPRNSRRTAVGITNARMAEAPWRMTRRMLSKRRAHWQGPHIQWLAVTQPLALSQPRDGCRSAGTAPRPQRSAVAARAFGQAGDLLEAVPEQQVAGQLESAGVAVGAAVAVAVAVARAQGAAQVMVQWHTIQRQAAGRRPGIDQRAARHGHRERVAVIAGEAP